LARKLTSAEKKYLSGATDKTLAGLRRAYRVEIISQVSRLVSEQTTLANKLDRRIATALVYRKDGTLTAASRRRVERAIQSMVDDALAKFADRLDITVSKGTRANAEATAKFLERKGFDVDRAKVKSIATKVADADKKFYGATTKQRVKSIGKKQIARVTEVLDSTRGNDKDRDKIFDRAASPLGGDRTPAGSMLRDMTRVFVADAVRKAVDADTQVMTESGVEFAYRRLSDLHIFRDRVEFCEELNMAVYPGIRTLLRRAGIDSSGVDLEGLYPVDDVPELPHASCMCFLEPLIV
jgi:hypothetical protein